MNKYAVLAEGFGHLSYPLGKGDSADGQVFSCRREDFVLHRVESKVQAEMAVGAYDWLSQHAAEAVGYVKSGSGEFFTVCRLSGSAPNPAQMSEKERLDFSLAVVRRLATLHSQGFGCGGLSPDAIDYSRKEARVKNPSAIFALTDADSPFFEAVATLRALAGKGFAAKNSMERLAYGYVSFSPACRHAVHAYLRSKKMKLAHPHRALAAHARKFLAYF